MNPGPRERYTSTSPGETRAIGEAIGAALAPGSLVLLVGPLGSGKTVLAGGIAAGLGVADVIVSPTYTIVADYHGRVPFVHVDLYRVEGPSQIENLGLDELAAGPGVTVVEWGEKLEPMLPVGDAVRASITVEPDGSRTILLAGLPS